VAKTRVDVLLVERGLAPTRARAQALVLAGRVYTADRRVEKPGDSFALDAPLAVRGDDHPYVSRGGVKLRGAIDAFALDASGLVCADFGASTGGFTDCLLEAGAKHVYAIDVGKGQLHQKLRVDPRVRVLEGVNARHLDAASLGESVDLVVVDASFIGLGKLLPAIKAVLRPLGEVVALVKPQFEVGRAHVGKGGVVRDEGARSGAIEGVSQAASELGFETLAQADSVLTGPKGNREAFLHLRLRPE
jgi:23S rRNA (cytidine1920-2'-O)/16S rRNA (cytidine1409-2'-O)-methyltransferase